MEATTDDTIIRVSIGTEPMQHVPGEVLKSSIRRRTVRTVEFTQSWSLEHGWHPLMSSVPRLRRGTKFNTWRWLVPLLYGTGRAIYLDADQVVLADIAELWHSLDDDKEIAAVTQAEGFFGEKLPEPDKVQSSVMVLRCEALAARSPAERIRDVLQGALPYRDLMQAIWIPRDRVQSLPAEWNHFGIVTPATKLCHWSHVASQPYRNPNHPTAEIFTRELIATVHAGHLQLSEVREATRGGDLSPVYLKRLKQALEKAPAELTVTRS